jgi:hypothetical protein
MSVFFNDPGYRSTFDLKPKEELRATKLFSEADGSGIHR